MSRLGAKTYSRKQDCKTSVQFEHLLADKGNKPSTAKVSVAGVHRWGMTSFTSLRKSRLNGQKEVSEPIEPVKRPKLDPTPEYSSYTGDPFGFDADIQVPSQDSVVPKVVHTPNVVKVEAKPAPPKPNKFFKSGSRGSKNTAAKNADFDALRLSTNSNCGPKVDKELDNSNSNVHSNYKNDVPNDSYFPSNPSIVDLRYPGNSNSCASSKYSEALAETYIRQQIQPFKTADNSSVAFDALFSVDLSNKTSNYHVSHPLNTVIKPTESKSDNGISTLSHGIDNVLNSRQYNTSRNTNPFPHQSEYQDSGMYMPYVPVEKPSVYVPEKEKTSVSQVESEKVNERPAMNNLESQNSLETISLSSQACSSSQEIASSQEFSSSQSSDKVEDSSQSSKSSSRPKKIFSSSLKFKAVYNHRHWHSAKKSEESTEAQPGASLADEFEEDSAKEVFREDLVSEVANTSAGDIRSYKCPKASKEYYTVVKNVKQAYQCHESGETQEFNDDIEYLLECVQECNAIGTRCLSVLNLAAKCMGPAFRIHLRAHGTMPKIFSALKDAPTDPNLALCTATLMFVLSQDRLTMDIEASTLSLMLQLLETDPEMRSPEKEIDLILKDPALCAMQDKHREKVFSLCEEMQQKGHAKHLKLDNLNTGILAMETLLSLTSRKAGEWFKEEMRTLGGLDRIADTVSSSVELLIPEEKEIATSPTEAQLDKLKKIDRCLRVLENVTHMNSENQEYVMVYKDSSLILTLLNLMKLCKSHLLEQTPVEVDMTTDEQSQKDVKEESPILSCLLDILKILSNITYRTPLNDSQFPAEEGLMDQLLVLILQVPRAVVVEKRFDLLVLSLGLMINLVEYCAENSNKFIEMNGLGSFDTVNDGYEMPAAEALIELVLARLDAARASEDQADQLLSTQEEKHAASMEKKDLETAADDLEETLMKTLQKAGKHMEHSIIAAYIVILLGCVCLKNSDFIDVLRDYVPDGKFDVLVEVLKKFKSFVSLTGSVGNRELVSIQKVIQVLEFS